MDNWGNESQYSNEVRSGSKAISSPFLQSLSVDHGIEGTQVSVSGVNFGDRKGTVYVGAKRARVMRWSEAGDSIIFISPKRLPYETYEVGVVTAGKARSENVLPYQVMRASITGSSAGSGAPGAQSVGTCRRLDAEERDRLAEQGRRASRVPLSRARRQSRHGAGCA